MNWSALTERLKPKGWGRAAPFVVPPVVLEVEPDFVVGARLDGSSRQVRRLGIRELESGVLTPTPHRPNMTNEAVVREAVREVAATVGNGSGPWGLLLPDAGVRVSLLSFETLPEDRQEAEALVRWRMREVLPFPTEEARVAYQVLFRETSSVELLAMGVRNSVLAEYEAALEGVNGGPSLIIPATVALLPLLPEEGEAGQLLVHACSGSVNTVVVEMNRVRFWRNRPLTRLAPEAFSEEVSREVARVLAACRDHHKIEIGKVWVCARPPASAELTEELASALDREVLPLRPGPELTRTLPPSEQELFGRYGTTFAGLVANLG